MIDAIQLPSSAIQYIRYQRTEYIWSPINKVLGSIRSTFPYLADRIEVLFLAKRFASCYTSDMMQEYSSIKEHLPKNCRRVLDIGCGISGIDIFINEHYKGDDVQFFLLDKSVVEKKIYYGFHERGEFYNSLAAAKKTLLLNGVHDEQINLVEVNETNDINIEGQVDLVISLRSWGFHYPVPVYLDRVHELLSKDGILILDVRKNTDGLNILKSKFTSCKIIPDSRDHNHIVCHK